MQLQDINPELEVISNFCLNDSQRDELSKDESDREQKCVYWTPS